MTLAEKFSEIKCFCFDLDGVLTDGTLTISTGEEWIRKMDIKDGYALQLAVKQGYSVIIISGSTSLPVKERLEKLGVAEVHMNISQKLTLLKEIMGSKKIDRRSILFMGDDVPDLECLNFSGLAACPSNAAIDVKDACHYISPQPGGRGCVRDVIEKVLKLQNNWPLQSSVKAL